MPSSYFYLTLPVAATICNVLLASLLNNHHVQNAHAQQQHHHSPAQWNIGGRDLQRQQQQAVCIDPLGTTCLSDDDDQEALLWEERPLAVSADETRPKDDHQLQLIPGTDFEAYVRADVATFYRREPGSLQEKVPTFQGQACKFVNLSPDRVAIYWISNNQDESFITNVAPFNAGGTSCFPGHHFIVADPNNPKMVLADIRVVHGTSVYYFDPFLSLAQPVGHVSDPHARAILRPTTSVLSLDQVPIHDKLDYQDQVYNLKFGERYRNFTGGSEWLAMYNGKHYDLRPPHFIWPAEYLGQEHHVQVTETHFTKIPNTLQLKTPLSISEMSRFSHDGGTRDNSTALALAEYREPGSALNLTLQVASCHPRALVIEHFLSDAEADHVLELVRQMNMGRSTTGGHVSSTRTSTTTWLPRNTDEVLNSIYRRMAQVLKIDESLLRDREPDEYTPDYVPSLKPINEALQIVHYTEGQEYTAHHDFGYNLDSPSRSINLCLYLNDVAAGGETAFTRWRNAETSDAIKVKPQKGKALIFYMVQPDGNLDDLTQHAAMPVIKGEKWFSNLWIHRPYFE